MLTREHPPLSERSTRATPGVPMDELRRRVLSADLLLKRHGLRNEYLSGNVLEWSGGRADQRCGQRGDIIRSSWHGPLSV